MRQRRASTRQRWCRCWSTCGSTGAPAGSTLTAQEEPAARLVALAVHGQEGRWLRAADPSRCTRCAAVQAPAASRGRARNARPRCVGAPAARLWVRCSGAPTNSSSLSAKVFSQLGLSSWSLPCLLQGGAPRPQARKLAAGCLWPPETHRFRQRQDAASRGGCARGPGAPGSSGRHGRVRVQQQQGRRQQRRQQRYQVAWRGSSR